MHSRGVSRFGHVSNLPQDRSKGKAQPDVVAPPTNSTVVPAQPNYPSGTNAAAEPSNTIARDLNTPPPPPPAVYSTTSSTLVNRGYQKTSTDYREPYGLDNKNRTTTVMQDEDIVRDERLIEACHHIHIKSIPKSLWVLLVGILGGVCACLALLIVLVAR